MSPDAKGRIKGIAVPAVPWHTKPDPMVNSLTPPRKACNCQVCKCARKKP